MFPKVLICCPTAKAKNYCFKEWATNVVQFTYPNYDVVMFDNTDDDGTNAKNLNIEFKALFSDIDIDFKVIHSKVKNIASTIERMCISHNDCRDYILNNEYDYMLHLESDVIPEQDIIESLLIHNKQVIGGLYYIDEGAHRKIMVQQMIDVGFGIVTSTNFSTKEDVYFIDGNVKRVASVGLGCVLIHKSVFKKIKFRFQKNVDKHPDSYFSEDCLLHSIPIYAETSKIASHENTLWIK